MRRTEVVIGAVYLVLVSGKHCPVRIDGDHPYGGWFATNLATGRGVRIRTAGRLRRQLQAGEIAHWAPSARSH